MTISLSSILAALMLLTSVRFSHSAPPTASADTKAVRYTIVDVGILRDDDQAVVTGLSNSGQVVGYCYKLVPPGHGNFLLGHAFCWSKGKIAALPTLGGTFNHALAINGAGDIVGDADDLPARTLPALWPHTKQGGGSSKPVPLSQEDGYAAAIADNGHIVGMASQPFLYADGRVTPFELPVGSRLSGVNSLDEIVGFTAVNTGFGFAVGEEQGFVWRKGQLRRLPTLGGKKSVSRRLNDSGKIIGWAETQTGERHACYWANDLIHDLGTLGGKDSEANGINAQGDIVGESILEAQQGDLACLWQNGKIVNLNTCLAANSGWILRTANGINARGEITGVGSHKGQEHAFLLRPVSAMQLREHHR